MITIFRHIRQGLLNQNKFSRYLLYALGEILLVVIGILIALQINTWNEERKAKITEHQFFEKVLVDLGKDKEKLQYYHKFLTGRLKALDTLLTYVRDPRKTLGIKMFGQYVEPLYYTENPTLYSTTFESAKAMGTFTTFSQKELLKELSQYYADFVPVENNINSLTRFVEKHFEPLMYTLPEGYMDENTGDLVINEEKVNAFYAKVASIKDYRNIDYDYEKIMRNPIMENYLIGDMGRTYNALGKINVRHQQLDLLINKIKDL